MTLEVKRYCCRRMFISNVELIDEFIQLWEENDNMTLSKTLRTLKRLVDLSATALDSTEESLHNHHQN
jgi:hypothetical protein